ncbi:putative DNA binding domain-containing protein [Methanocorpusculum sp. MG]|uniref:DNA binding domain-containing protein n=1 Tax=Methanocorpusculum petauri TaxID=3002863 RepID=A0ABT4IHW2_9EURY|nr:ATP-binding protein [Methanocorpusculum petauri]MCZ0861329.1 putative DNA binding domain-containing protein [Methanocorpusculum petauri]MDE2443208.1 putative DNA binding domain-containing protein [Methanocorpusculum sp.]
MHTVLELLAILQQKEEHKAIEAKPGNEVGRDVKETISAFSNTTGLGGGYILFGITENHSDISRYLPTGVSKSEKVQNDLATQCKTNFNIPIRPDVQVDVINGKTIIAAYIPEADPGQKPVYIQSLGMQKGSYIRIGACDQLCTDNDFAMLFSERNSKPYDTSLLNQLSIDDLDPDAVAEYRKLRSLADPSASELLLDNQALLLSLKCIDESNGILHPTIAGLYLFGKRDTLKREYPMNRLDYIRVQGTTWNPGLTKSYYTLEMNEGLFSLLPRVESAIMDDIPRTIGLPDSGLFRDDYPSVPSLVIREALVNAVMHRDYRVNSPTQIIRYSDRIEFRNPGHSLKLHLEKGDPGSILRNPRIANVLHETKYAENKGTGISIMLQEMKKANLSVPTFISDRENNFFAATVYLHNLAQGDELCWISQFKEHNLTNPEIQILMFLRGNGTVKNADCRDLLQMDSLGVSNLLKHLRLVGVLQQHGGGPGTYYTLSDNYSIKIKSSGELYPKHEFKDLEISNPKNQQNFQLNDIARVAPQMPDKDLEISNLKSNQNLELSKIGKSQFPNDVYSGLDRNILLTLLPGPLRRDVESLPGRINEQEARSLIRRICTSPCGFMPNQIATILSRRREWVMSYLQVMQNEQILEMVDPSHPTSRKQRYRTISSKKQSNLEKYL